MNIVLRLYNNKKRTLRDLSLKFFLIIISLSRWVSWSMLHLSIV